MCMYVYMYIHIVSYIYIYIYIYTYVERERDLIAADGRARDVAGADRLTRGGRGLPTYKTRTTMLCYVMFFSDSSLSRKNSSLRSATLGGSGSPRAPRRRPVGRRGPTPSGVHKVGFSKGGV